MRREYLDELAERDAIDNLTGRVRQACAVCRYAKILHVDGPGGPRPMRGERARAVCRRDAPIPTACGDAVQPYVHPTHGWCGEWSLHPELSGDLIVMIVTAWMVP